MRKNMVVLSLCLVLRVWWNETTSFTAWLTQTHQTVSGVVQVIGGGWIVVKRDDTGKSEHINSNVITASNWEDEKGASK